MTKQDKKNSNSVDSQLDLFEPRFGKHKGEDKSLAGTPDRAQTWDHALTHRLRVLLHTFPLHDLRLGDSRRDPELRHYDSLVLAMKVIDLIIDSAGLDREVDRVRVEQELKPLLVEMDEAAGLPPDGARHKEIIDRVLGGLRNDADRRRPFEFEYTDFDEKGKAIRRKLEFRLVADHFHPAGGTVLRLSNEAINLYLNALELDIEDAQAAAEAVVQSQLARGRFDEAVQTARNARLQSLRYKDKVAGIIRETHRDITSVDWQEQIPRLLKEALSHIDSRLTTERNILNTAEERLSVLEPEDEGARAISEVVRLIRDCRIRHVDLHDQLMRARNVFLDEQSRQAFAPAPMTPLPNLLSEVLEPILQLDQSDAAKALERAFPCFTGPSAPSSLSLAELVSWLLRPRREPPPTEVPVVDPELSQIGIDLTYFDDDVRAQVKEALSDLNCPVKLSSLLERLSSLGLSQSVLELTTLAALQAFAPDQEESMTMYVERIPDSVLNAFGFFGDELQLNPPGGNNDQGSG